MQRRILFRKPYHQQQELKKYLTLRQVIAAINKFHATRLYATLLMLALMVVFSLQYAQASETTDSYLNQTITNSPPLEVSKKTDSYLLEGGFSVQALSDKTFEIISLSGGTVFYRSRPFSAGVYLDIDKSFSETFQRTLGGVMLYMGADWRFNFSAQDLQRLSYLSYENEDRYFNGRKQSLGAGIDYFGLNGEYLQKIGLSAVFSNTNDHSFGLVEYGSSETRELYRVWEEYLYFQGSKNLRVQLYSDICLADNMKLVPTAGFAYRAYNDLGEQYDENSDDVETNPAGGLTLTYLTINNRLQLSGFYDHSGYTNDFGIMGSYRIEKIPGLQLQARAEHVVFDDSSQEDETLLVLGIKYIFNGSGYHDNLFKGKGRGVLLAADLEPVSGVENITLEGRQYFAKKTLTEIDKTALRARLAGLIEKARSLREAEYTAACWSSLEEALVYGETVYNKGGADALKSAVSTDGSATLIELVEAIDKLNKALENLVNNSGTNATLPLMGDISDQTAAVNTPFSLALASYVTSPDGDTITGYILSGKLPTGMNFNSTTGVLSGTPTAIGNYSFSAAARDKDGTGSSDNFALTVTPEANKLPVAYAGPDQSIAEGQTITLTGSGSDADGTIVAFKWSTAENTAIITVSPATTTTYTLQVQDNDGAWSVEDSVEVEVRPTVCGDGLKEGAEQCDDGNLASGDGCSSTCQIE
ncbi:MAG: putative Ig domain-containing protein [Pseudomonadota bacterium]